MRWIPADCGEDLPRQKLTKYVPRKQDETNCMHSESVVSDLIGLIYDAAGDPALWPTFLDQLGKTLRATTNNLFLQDVGPRTHPAINLGTIGMEPDFLHSYLTYYGAKNVHLMRGARIFRQGCVYRSEELCPDEDAIKTEFWNDWIAPQKMHHALFGVVLQELPTVSMLNVVRRRNAEPFRDEDLAVLGALLPHLRRAVQLHLRITDLESQRRAAAEALDHWAMGVILLDAQGDVLLMNQAAETVVTQSDGLALDRGGLHAATATDTKTLCALIHGAVETTLGRGLTLHPGGALALVRASGKRPLNVLVAPACTNDALFPQARAAAVVFVSDPETMEEPAGNILQRLYDLTRAETRVALLLASGKGLPQISGELSLSLNTVKTHAHRIFEKTGARGQAQFVQLVLQSPASVLNGIKNHPIR